MLKRLVNVRDEEVGALLWSWAYCFTLFCGYSILKPLRDQLGIAGRVSDLTWLFTGTFAAMLVAVPLYSALVARFERRRAIPLVYRFFLTNLLLFFVLLRLGIAPRAVAAAFFIWASVYNLFVVSVFWSFMADLFAREQGKRLFGFIAAGGTAGAIAGPFLAALLVRPLGPTNLMLLSAAFLELSVLCVGRLSRWARTVGTRQAPVPRDDDAPTGGGMFAGFRLLVRSPYLLGLGLQTTLYTVTSTLLYFHQARIVSAAVAGATQRTALFASIDLWVNVLTLLIQTLLTGRLIQRLGLAVALAIIPTLTALGFAGLAALPTLWLLVAVKSLRSSTHYAIERPAREILFTVVDREEKYKSKSFIDTVIYRGGDMVSGWFQAGLTSLGLGMSGIALTAIPLAGLWLAVSLFLARRHEDRAREATAPALAVQPALPTRRSAGP